MSNPTLKKFPFSKSARLLKGYEFSSIRAKGRKVVGRYLVAYTLEKEGKKLGLTVSRRYGKAHERNRFKRQCREAFRLTAPNYPNHIHINILPRAHAKQAKTADLAAELQKLVLS